jgi:uncharacterized protein YegL
MTQLDEMAIEFATNAERRSPCVLVLDTSSSMGGRAIDELNAGIALFKRELDQNSLARLRVEVAIVTFGASGVQVLQDFVTVDQFDPPVLTTGGLTPLGEGVTVALDLLEERVNTYQQYGIASYRPWVFLITDGGPSDEWQSAAQRVRTLERTTPGIMFFAIGVANADMNVLGQLTARPPVHLEGLEFEKFFKWVSASSQRVSLSQPGEQVELPPLDWGTVASA